VVVVPVRAVRLLLIRQQAAAVAAPPAAIVLLVAKPDAACAHAAVHAGDDLIVSGLGILLPSRRSLT